MITVNILRISEISVLISLLVCMLPCPSVPVAPSVIRDWGPATGTGQRKIQAQSKRAHGVQECCKTLAKTLKSVAGSRGAMKMLKTFQKQMKNHEKVTKSEEINQIDDFVVPQCALHTVVEFF